jgi:predicted ATPase/DNA-binding CsgD family transcriptional regulator
MPRTDRTSAGNLPVELTSFIGRRRELAEVKRLLAESRLVTLTGVGGTGKTRLAVRAASEVRRALRDGVWFVDLTAVRPPELPSTGTRNSDVVAYQILLTLGVREQPGGPPATEQLVRHLTDRQALLVLDNCERLLPDCAALAATLLRSCLGVRVVATSREPLLLTGEVIFAVPPLQTPHGRVSLAEAGRCEAVALLVARAQAAAQFALTEHTADVVGELCRRLDGLPLAIELAAGWMRVLSPAQILDRLSDRFALLSQANKSAPARQQTLRACVDWSFDLCSERERLLWARLTVFSGGFELDAVEGVCADEVLPAADLLDVVAGLVDKSVVVCQITGDVSRYRMLETVRDYGREKLIEAGEQAQLRLRHRDWYQHLSQQVQADFISPRQPNWIARLEREVPNFRAAVEFSLADPDGAEAALATTAGLLPYWGVRGLPSEACSWLDQVLARPCCPSMTLVKALYCITVLAFLHGDRGAASRGVRQAREVAVQLGDARAHAIASSAQGALEAAQGDLAAAVSSWQDAVNGLASEESEEHLLYRADTLAGLAMAKGMSGDVDGAAHCHEALLALCQPRGESWLTGYSLWSLGLALRQQGDLIGAAARLRDGLQHLRRVNDTLAATWCLDALAWTAFDQGQPQRAATLLGAVTRLAHTAGTLLAAFEGLAGHHEQYKERTCTALGEPAYQAAFAYGEGLSLDETVDYALDRDPRPPAAPPREGAASLLTRREWQVADLVARGLSNKEIAAKLTIAQRTAESHVDHILSKLGHTNRAQVAAWIVARSSDNSPDR